MALNASRYISIEALRGDMGWNTFRETYMKATLMNEVMLERMEDRRIARKIYLWNVRSSRWKKCIKIVDRSGMLVVWVHIFSKGRESVYEWKVMNRKKKKKIRVG